MHMHLPWPHRNNENGSGNRHHLIDGAEMARVEILSSSNGLAACVNMRIDGPMLGAGTIYAVDIPEVVARHLAEKVLGALAEENEEGTP